MADNAFLSPADSKQAQTLAGRLDAKQLNQRLDLWARQFCPIHKCFRSGYQWSFMPVEFATDVVFHKSADFQPLYESIICTAVHAIKADNVATFLSRELTQAYQGEVGNDFPARIQGTRIRNQMGPASIKLYDKAAVMARIECIANDGVFFKLHRWVEQREGWHHGNWPLSAKTSTTCTICANH